MKKTTNANVYPNAANRQYRIDKAIDTALTAAATVGLVISLLFVIIL